MSLHALLLLCCLNLKSFSSTLFSQAPSGHFRERLSHLPRWASLRTSCAQATTFLRQAGSAAGPCSGNPQPCPGLPLPLAPLQIIAGPKPLLVTELGLDSRAHGEEAQAAFFQEQLPAAFAAGAAGMLGSQAPCQCCQVAWLHLLGAWRCAVHDEEPSLSANLSAGTFAFAWTDEWWRGGKAVTDWWEGLRTGQPLLPQGASASRPSRH